MEVHKGVKPLCSYDGHSVSKSSKNKYEHCLRNFKGHKSPNYGDSYC